MNMKTFPALMVSGSLLVLAATPATAHYSWVSPHNYTVTNGGLSFHIGSGHVFQVGGQLEAHRIREVILSSPNDEHRLVETNSGSEFTIGSMQSAGPYMLSMIQTRSPYSRTRSGGQAGSRATLEGVLSCTQSVNTGKALLGGGAVLDQPVHHPLEIIPLADPSALSVGDHFPIQVLFHDEPYQGEVMATYGGHDGGTGEYPVRATADANGMAKVPLGQAVEWMFKVTATSDYFDPSVCDFNDYLATLTFEIN